MGEMADYQIEQILSGVPGVDICPDCGGDLLGQCECSVKEKPARKKRKRGTQALRTTNKVMPI